MQRNRVRTTPYPGKQRKERVLSSFTTRSASFRAPEEQPPKKTARRRSPTQKVTKTTVSKNIEIDQKTQPLAAELAYNLMELCSKYVFVLKQAYGEGADGVAEVDICIKVKPLKFLPS